MATYPSDATAPVTAFPVVAEITYSSTGASRTYFNLPTTVAHKGEVTAFLDGALQQTSTYDLANAGQSINFVTAPNATELIVKTISLPERFRLTRSFPSVRSIDYSNTTATTVDSNTYVVNANTETFAIPSGVNVSSATEIMVFLGGVLQRSSAFTFPSITLGTAGIDIGDNTATKLLLNFDGTNGATTTTDASDSAHTVTFNGDAQLATADKVFGDSSLKLDGTGDYLSIAASTDFTFLTDDMTIETYFNVAADVTTNASILSKFESINRYYSLRVVGANSNVGFVYIDQTNDANIELYGGNVNGAISYHVAVSRDDSTNNVMLYVNNVLVANGYLGANVAGQAMGGVTEIGRTGSFNTTGEPLNGHIDALRISRARRYYGNGIEPANTAPTVIGGAPLGSGIDKGVNEDGETLSIRVFDAEITSLDRFSSMADRKPDKGFSTSKQFDVATFTSQSGYEKRRLKSRRSKRQYSLSYTNITGVEKTAIENFYNARSGEHEAFTFDLSHLNESGTITSRFSGPLQIEQVLSAGANLTQNFYTVSFNLQEVFD